MQKLVMATSNVSKLKEIKEILGEDFNVIGLRDVFQDEVHIVEDGNTFIENALIKARFVYNETKEAVLADDSGIIVDCMEGVLGVHSARYMQDAPYCVKNQSIIDFVKDKKRTCRYICAIVYINHEGLEFVVEESMEGLIHDQICGENGFGYDPIFYYPPLKMTAAMMDPSEKNKHSHRGKAVAKILNIIKGE